MKEQIMDRCVSSRSQPDETVLFGWYDGSPDPDEIAAFFARNAGSTYISHTDIQWGRALDAQRWSPDLHRKIADLAIEAKGRGNERSPGIRLVTARTGPALAGIAFLTARPDADRPYAILEDLLVGSDHRGRGIGSSMLQWVRDQCRLAGIEKMFLESNLGNERAHALFHRLGFTPLSVVMSCDL
ncbi:hypothetical protein C3731_16215 [Brucella oryzae]|uniref:N-acetyltransferase domain-containing protein n=1 Tax=Brucella oryzae TaxID=335286 RepID=A0A2S7IWQ8_9HYPH|nr:hypothetical protein C3731_16215 [Brucella oryzae]